MSIVKKWRKEEGTRVAGTRDLDLWKVQAPGIVKLPSGGYRLFYTAIGPAKPFPLCQGYILSATSQDGLNFEVDSGIRLAPQQHIPKISLRLLAPCITSCGDGRWRMYFEARGPASMPTVICSAISNDLLEWTLEEGVRVRGPGSARAPRILKCPDDRLRMYFILTETDGSTGQTISQGVWSAFSTDGLDFDIEPGCRLRDRQGELDSAGITAGEVIPPDRASDPWTMVFSGWQDVPPGTVVPLHPSQDPDAESNGLSENFAASSIRSDLAGYRSRIFVSESNDGMNWGPSECILEGDGYGGSDMDAVHAEDMCLIRLDDGRYRMYYAACDTHGTWRILSAVTEE